MLLLTLNPTTLRSHDSKRPVGTFVKHQHVPFTSPDLPARLPYAGMQQLMPYLSQHVVDEVAGGVRSLPRLHMALRLVKVRWARGVLRRAAMKWTGAKGRRRQ